MGAQARTVLLISDVLMSGAGYLPSCELCGQVKFVAH